MCKEILLSSPAGTWEGTIFSQVFPVVWPLPVRKIPPSGLEAPARQPGGGLLAPTHPPGGGGKRQKAGS